MPKIGWWPLDGRSPFPKDIPQPISFHCHEALIKRRFRCTQNKRTRRRISGRGLGESSSLLRADGRYPLRWRHAKGQLNRRQNYCHYTGVSSRTGTGSWICVWGDDSTPAYIQWKDAPTARSPCSPDRARDGQLSRLNPSAACLVAEKITRKGSGTPPTLGGEFEKRRRFKLK